jgi:predicted nucleotidyltransferase
MTTRVFTEQEAELLRRVREAVKAVEPDAQIILYGSRARGDAEPDSDWDILVILAGPVFDKEAILYAELNADDRRHTKAYFDALGHYSRRDIFRFDFKD